MATYTWIPLTLAGAALAAPACALVLGAEELPQGMGGAGTTSGTTSSRASSGAQTGGATSSSTGSHTSSAASSSSSTAASSASSAGATCDQNTDCTDCAVCMESGPCNPADAGCPDGSICLDYTECVVQCAMDPTGYATCAKGCLSTPPPGVDPLKTCVCTQCGKLCPQFCK